MNTFGKLFRLTTFGESHGSTIGGIIDGCPAGLSLDLGFVQQQLDRRRPGQSEITTSRQEHDVVHIESGLFQGITTGSPIGFFIKNKDQKSKDYDHYKDVFRPSHADFTYQNKYGNRDFRGGGRSSARETANWVVAGSIAQQLIANLEVSAFVSSIGNIHLNKSYSSLDFSSIYDSMVRCPDKEISAEMIQLIKDVQSKGDSVGGVVSCVVKNMPIGLGEPIFNKLNAALAHAMMSINAAKGFELGSGFCASEMLGSQHNDIFNEDGTTKTNHSGGVVGGISNGMDIYFRVAFKPASTIMKTQSTINKQGVNIKLEGKGRHDPCVVPRAVAVVRAMTTMVLADFFLQNKLTKI